MLQAPPLNSRVVPLIFLSYLPSGILLASIPSSALFDTIHSFTGQAILGYQSHTIHPMSSTHSPPVSPAWSGSRRPSQRSSGPKSPSDPPRSARDGFEWVWYPEGYWAERPLERRRSSNKSQSSSTVGKKILSWAPRSKHSPKDRAHGALERPMTPVDIDSDHEVLLSPRGFSSISPISQQPRLSHFMPARGLPQSPYLSEQEQVAALQNPAFITAREHVDSEDTWKSSSPVGESAEGETAAPRRGTMAAIAPRSLWMSMHNHRVKVSEM